MTDDKKASNRESNSAESDIILDLNFVPQWARKPPDEGNYGRFKDGDSGGGRGRGSSRGGSGGRYGGGGGGRSGGRPQDRRPQQRRDAGPSKPGGTGGPGAPQARYRGPRSESEVSARVQPQSSGARPSYNRERVPLAPLHVRFLPEQQALTALVKQVSVTRRAYPLLDLAGLMMSKPGCCFVKMEVNSDAPETSLYQCKKCRTVAFSRDEIENHILSDHLEDYFDVEEVEGDAPTGNFVCVAKCGYSGVLLGPPNHHSYNETVRRIHADRFANINFESYKGRIKMSHDPEDVERWKIEAAKTVNYTLKSVSAKPAPTPVEPSSEEPISEEIPTEKLGEESVSDGPKPLSRSEAERYIRDEIVDKNVTRTKKTAISETIAHSISDRSIKFALRDEWQNESRFPIKLSFALRAAFKHKNMYIFKAGKGKGINFVTAVQPTPLDPEHVIPSIKDVLTYLTENPGCTKKQMVEALRPDVDLDSEEVKELLQPLQWLVERGHIIEFFNGTFSVPMMRKTKNKEKDGQ